MLFCLILSAFSNRMFSNGEKKDTMETIRRVIMG